MNRDDLIKELGRIIDVGIVNAHHDKAVLEEIREELKKPVMVITAGDYSDYHIVGVSFERETAERVSKLCYDRNRIEAYVPIEWADGSEVDYNNEAYLLVEWNPDNNKIERAEAVSFTANPFTDSYGHFRFIISMRSRAAIDVMQNGKDSDLLKKIAQDKYAEYQNEQLEKRYRQFGGT